MTLHLAIEEVLTRAGRPLTPRQIADEVNRRGLYVRGDGTPLPAGQVSARVRKYPALFVATSGGIWLVDRAVPADVAVDITVNSPPPAEEESPHRPVFAPSSEQPSAIAAALLASAGFRSARDIDDDVPDRFGLYAIRVRSIDVLPEPYRSIAQERDSDLIYLGEATGQTLRARFLRNEIRGRGHGTFFRSIGAVLGYRPAVGSLVAKGNQRNFRFSPADTAAVVEWINENLVVSWVAFDEGVHVTEVALIRSHTPLLNLRDNPAALPELSKLRALCVEIATSTPSA
ncbi:winged helix-turn-helix domain-containing protein [Microbacterium sp. ARD31]|uniref:winged helix-turn-helix domain-containing protein n=1 Tax=Microbacterium sp. ARD31 TaxID=2962576 RepID=UPI002882121A|nr:winged helix-turn-helix domain-containing protein [Microbacterium sp. ARD31]MDT0181457.1 winged helix-turn-helix domain-containing protein [Microbacterium sp. ARD31]